MNMDESIENLAKRFSNPAHGQAFKNTMGILAKKHFEEQIASPGVGLEQEYEEWLKANVPPEAHEGLGHDLSCENLLCRDSASPEDGKWTPTEVQAEWLRHFFNRWMDMERREGQS